MLLLASGNFRFGGARKLIEDGGVASLLGFIGKCQLYAAVVSRKRSFGSCFVGGGWHLLVACFGSCRRIGLARLSGC